LTWILALQWRRKEPTKSREERVADLETIYAELPEILNLRFDGLRAQASETISRL
jgi:hypothetical protein